MLLLRIEADVSEIRPELRVLQDSVCAFAAGLIDVSEIRPELRVLQVVILLRFIREIVSEIRPELRVLQELSLKSVMPSNPRFRDTTRVEGTASCTKGYPPKQKNMFQRYDPS